MEFFKPLTASEQLVVHLREAISKGDLTGHMPGIRSLATSLGVSSNTVTSAVEQLEREGFLKPQGHGRRSRIVIPEGMIRPKFRVTLLPYERADIELDYVVEIQRQLKPEKIYGVDISRDMLDIGRAKIREKGWQDSIELQDGDSENLHFEPNTFDAVTVAFGVRNF